MLKAIQNEAESGGLPGKGPRPALDRRFLVQLKGKEFVTYAGLLDLAHQHGLGRLEVEIIQFPSAENNMECICRASAVSESGMVYTDIGDANPLNTNKMVSQHIIRMASTRAKARVLRDFTNIGITALEELGDDVGDTANAAAGKPGNGSGKAKSSRAPVAVEKKAGDVLTPITEAQKRAIATLARRSGYDDKALNSLAMTTCGKGVAELSSKDASALIVQLQQPN